MPLPAPNVYELDPTGVDPDNLIVDEIHTITAENTRDYHYLVPDFAPFYAVSVVVQHKPVGGSAFVPLTKDVDYIDSYPYIGATLRTEKWVGGALSFLNLQLAGEVKLSYQTVGGEFTLDQDKITQITADIVYNPRITTWEQVADAPVHFPPHAHAYKLEDVKGQAEVVGALNEIRDALLANQSASLLSHLRDKGNPHRVRKDQIGLDKVANFAPATIAQAILGVSDDSYMTPKAARATIQQLDSRQYITLQEMLSKQPVGKIVTYDMLLEFLRVFGIMTDIDPITIAPNKPNMLYPVNMGIYTHGNFMRALPYSGLSAGAINKTQSLNGIGTLSVPQGVNSIKFTGRGAVGTTTATGGSMTAGTPTVTPADFETRATVSDIPTTITGEQGQITARVVSSQDNLNEVMAIPLLTASGSQRVYSTSFPISTSSSGQVVYATITVIYSGTPPSITNVPGADANVTLLTKTHNFPGSPNANTIPAAKGYEVILNVNAATTVSYVCPAGTDVTATWHEPASSTAKVQVDTEWQIANNSDFASGNIVDSTAVGKGPDFTLSAWKPTRDALVANTIYFVRSRWKFNDNTFSEWSVQTEFSFQPTNIFPDAGTILGYFCKGVDQWANVADGQGSFTEQVANRNSTTCGYDTGGGVAPINTSVLTTPSITIRRDDIQYMQNGGTHPFQTTVQIQTALDSFVENIEDDRIRLYLTDNFYSEYLTFKNSQGTASASSFRIPFKTVKSGTNEDIKIELVVNMSPTRLGKTTLEPYTYYVKVSFTSTGYATTYEEWINKTTVDMSIDPAIFKDGTGTAFVAQSLVDTSKKNLTAVLKGSTVISYKPT